MTSQGTSESATFVARNKTKLTKWRLWALSILQARSEILGLEIAELPMQNTARAFPWRALSASDIVWGQLVEGIEEAVAGWESLALIAGKGGQHQSGLAEGLAVEPGRILREIFRVLCKHQVHGGRSCHCSMQVGSGARTELAEDCAQFQQAGGGPPRTTIQSIGLQRGQMQAVRQTGLARLPGVPASGEKGDGSGDLLRTVVAAALGECVHVAGISNFLRLAEIAGWRTVFLGPAVPIPKVLEAARKEKAELVGVSYRLTPETGERLLGQFAEEADALRGEGVHFAFGGTPPVAERVRALGFFERVFDGSESPEQVLAYLKGQPAGAVTESDFPQSTCDRIAWRAPFPLLRHHFGLPTLEATIQGIRQIAEAEALDVISLGTDQDAQEHFFHPERQSRRRTGAGGVPVRSTHDFRALYAASRRGNFPLLRAYSGTDDFLRYAEMLTETIHNAWCAIPLFWFNQMDRRGPWDLEGSIRQHQNLMQWYGQRHIPVELNEPHHWGMRDAPDVIFVVSGYLSAYNARHFGVRDYIAQMMFNSPPGTRDAMDLAKMSAILQMIEPLAGEDFRIWRQTRIGLLSHPLDPEAARGHLAAGTYLQMALRPHIYHIVGHTEAHHAATADDIVQASKIVRRAIANALGAPDPSCAPEVQQRTTTLVREAQVTLQAIRQHSGQGVADPLVDPATLARAVTTGILDAPQLRNNDFARGRIQTRIVDGACEAVDEAGHVISEEARLAGLGQAGLRSSI